MALSSDGRRSTPTQTAAIAAGTTADTVVKAAPGALGSVLVTALNGAAAITIYDNASTHSGTIIGYIPANAAAGSLYTFNMPFQNGCTVQGASTNGSLTLAYW
jgi:hypothetical protein